MYIQSLIDSSNAVWNYISGGNIVIYPGADGKIVIHSNSNTASLEISDSGITIIGDLDVRNGASGTFTTADGKTVTVTDGIITSIV